MRLMAAALLVVLAPVCLAGSVSVQTSGLTPPAFSNKPNDTAVPVARFVLQASGNDVIVDAVRLDFSGAASADEAFGQLYLFFDADHNQTFDAAEELDETSTIAPNGTDGFVTFTETFTVLNDGFSRELLLLADIKTTAVHGDSFQFRIDAATSLVLPPASTDTITGTFPRTANAITIRNSETQLVPGSGNPATVRNVARGAQNVAALHAVLNCLAPASPGELVSLDLNTLSLAVNLANSSQVSGVQTLSLWQDDGDANFEPGAGEVLILSRTSADTGKWNLAGSVLTVVFDGTAIQSLAAIPAGQVRTFWVSISFASTPDVTCEVTLSRAGVLGSAGAVADYLVASPASLSGNVIQTTAPPPEPEPTEPPGEGGCAVGVPHSLPWVVLSVLAVVALFARKRMGRRAT